MLEDNIDLNNLITEVLRNQFTLVSGRAGTGKSFLLHKLREALNEGNLRIVTTAPTGVAAANINGQTLHSWLGMGLASGTIEELYLKLSRKSKNALQRTDVLLIDEISMVEPEFFKKISDLSKLVNRLSTPFGRMKVVMFGDFLQIPPITKSVNKQFVFQTDLWRSMNVQRMRLLKVYRQSDVGFLNMLNEVRCGQVSEKTEKIFKSRCILPPENITYTRLCTYRNQVTHYNQKKLKELVTPLTEHKGYFKVISKNPNLPVDQADIQSGKRIIATSDKYFPVIQELNLKIGAQVMMRCNIFLEEYNICNGSLGIILSIVDNDNILVDFSGLTLSVKRHTFSYECGSTNINFYQFPLSLSWAVTVHKSQGLTIDRILVDTDCFENGQMYVAFSRVRDLKGLYLTSFQRSGLKVSKEALEFEAE